MAMFREDILEISNVETKNSGNANCQTEFLTAVKINLNINIIYAQLG